MTAAIRPLRTSSVALVEEFPITVVADARRPAAIVSALKGNPNVANMATPSRNRKKQGTPPVPLFAPAGSAGLNACATRLAPKRTIRAGQYRSIEPASRMPSVSSSRTTPTDMMVSPITRLGVKNIRASGQILPVHPVCLARDFERPPVPLEHCDHHPRHFTNRLTPGRLDEAREHCHPVGETCLDNTRGGKRRVGRLHSAREPD